ncbi:2-acyl-1-lysophosphatidylinositol acyltransferase [[Candida] anglica]|uniref:2-acyl-1-lysophosphatidylinositol acyltransferase n=1 Tax=[Candida] anglica TaxID=148631 RepID=A0ABP0ELE2_9ASCO
MISRHNYAVAIVRTAILGPLFLLGCAAIVFTQEVSALLLVNSPKSLQAAVNLSKTHFISLLTFIAHIICPSDVSITYDESTKDMAFSSTNGHLSGYLMPNSVLISNHQIYTDWLSLWHILASTHLGNSVFIFLKDLSWIPVLGRGMKNYNFLFLSRKWEKDKIVLTNQLLEIDANARGYGPANGVKHVFSTSLNQQDSTTLQPPIQHWPSGKNSKQIWPYEILLYPEGTVTSPHTRIRSDKFCDRKGLPHLKHVLLPRVRGLFITLRKLRNTVEVVYDITTGYSGLKPGDNGEDIFTLKQFFLLGYGPKRVNHYIQTWKIADIPLGDDDCEDIDAVKEEDVAKFEQWLFKIWYEKDERMDLFYKSGSFETIPNTKTVIAEIKNKSILDLLSVFTPVIIGILILRLIWLGISRLIF